MMGKSRHRELISQLEGMPTRIINYVPLGEHGAWEIINCFFGDASLAFVHSGPKENELCHDDY